MSAITAPTVADVLSILERNYGETAYKNQKIAAHLVATIERVLPDISNGHLKYKVINIVWDNYAGGDLAEAVAAEILGY